MIGPIPNKAQALNPDGTLSDAWIEYLSETFLALTALQSSGPTAKRPTKYLFVGRTYYDTTIDKPIWIGSDGVTWKDATGLNV